MQNRNVASIIRKSLWGLAFLSALTLWARWRYATSDFHLEIQNIIGRDQHAWNSVREYDKRITTLLNPSRVNQATITQALPLVMARNSHVNVLTEDINDLKRILRDHEADFTRTEQAFFDSLPQLEELLRLYAVEFREFTRIRDQVNDGTSSRPVGGDNDVLNLATLSTKLQSYRTENAGAVNAMFDYWHTEPYVCTRCLKRHECPHCLAKERKKSEHYVDSLYNVVLDASRLHRAAVLNGLQRADVELRLEDATDDQRVYVFAKLLERLQESVIVEESHEVRTNLMTAQWWIQQLLVKLQ